VSRAAVLAAFRAESWREGWAHEWALDDGQRKWRAAFQSTEPLASSVWNIGRQRGKTFGAVFLSLEACVTTPGAVVRYCAKTKDSAIGIVRPAWDYLVSTMPREWRPVPGRSETEWVFPTTGATFVLFGTDAQSFAKGRGPKTNLQLFDEAGFYQDLVSVESALLPSLQTTGGRALYLSTPAESVGHPYTQRIYAAMAANRYRHDTFWSNPRVNHEAVIEAERTRLGMTREEFLACTYFRREYLAEIVTDETRAAMPAWTKVLADEVVGEWERPQFFDAYQAHDPGITGDPHASLFGWHDFERNELVIEDELELRSAPTTISAWVTQLKAKETELYGVTAWNGTLLGAQDWDGVPEYLKSALSTDAPRQPYLRLGDNATGVCKEMTLTHGLATLPTDKTQKAFHADSCNQLLATRRIRIHKRCKRLIAQLYSTVWNKSRSEWERNDTDHGDLVDCLIYISRNVRWHRDPRPKHVDTATRIREQMMGRAPANGWENFRKRRG
jgi:hypothetical protein